MTELKPCPLCGGEAYIKEESDSFSNLQNAIRCKDCLLTLYVDIDMTKSDEFNKQKAIAQWNNRPSPWHTGTPTEEGWYLVAYQHKNKMTYRAVRFFREKCLDMEFLDSEGGIYYPDIWKAVAWQKIEPYKEETIA